MSFHKSFHKIVVALDNSELGKAVFNQAVALAQSSKASLNDWLWVHTCGSLSVEPLYVTVLLGNRVALLQLDAIAVLDLE